MKKKGEEVDTSDWNMGVSFYKSLDELKWYHIMSFVDRDYDTSVDFLSSEIDWVSADISEDKLKILRGQVDKILELLEKPRNSIILKNLRRKIMKTRRELWDAEMKANITRPKDNTDLSGLPMPFINQR